MHEVTIYTDGACSGNPGPGGWGAVLICGDRRKEIGGGEPHTTNNRMEITGALKALEALKMACNVDIFSDSSYLVDAHLKHWLDGWERNNWTRKKGREVEEIPNTDLWKRLLELERSQQSVTWHKVRGHHGVPENEVCDKIATHYSALFGKQEL